MADSNIKDREIKVVDIPSDAKQLCLQRLIQPSSVIVSVGLAFALLYFKQTRIIGLFVCAYLAFLAFGVKNKKVILLTDKFAVSYNDDQETCKIVYYDEVKSWDISAYHDVYSIVFTTNDEQIIPMKTSIQYKPVSILKKS